MMEKSNSIKELISKVVKTEDKSEKLEILLELKDYLKDEKIHSRINLLVDSENIFEEKIEFYMTVADINALDYDRSFQLEVIPYCFDKTVGDRIEEFVELITNSEELQSKYADYFKNIEFSNDEMKTSMEYILGLPKFKEKVLADEEFISNKMINKDNFFASLPKEFGYLISLYNTKNDRELLKIQKMYEKYFGDTINKEEQLELISLQHDINIGPNVLDLSQKDRMLELEYTLKQIMVDKDFYPNMKSLKEKSNLDMKSIISLVYKYSDTELYKQLIDENKTFDRDTVEKIKYLANDDKVENVEEIEKLDLISIEDLRNMSKERRMGVKSNLRGGPQSKTSENIFSDGSNREIRRIDKNGKNKKISLSTAENHEDGVKRIYEGDLEFSKECTMAVERSLEAAKQLSSMTYVIEKEQCFVYIPSDISKEQKKVSVEWLNSAVESGILGIFVYDREKENFYIANNGAELDKNSAKDFILEMNEKITEEELDEIIINEADEHEEITIESLAKKAISSGVTLSSMQEVDKQLSNVVNQLDKNEDLSCDFEELDNGVDFSDDEW